MMKIVMLVVLTVPLMMNPMRMKMATMMWMRMTMITMVMRANER